MKTELGRLLGRLGLSVFVFCVGHSGYTMRGERGVGREGGVVVVFLFLYFLLLYLFFILFVLFLLLFFSFRFYFSLVLLFFGFTFL